MMNSCAVAVLEEYADLVLAYGFSDGFSFVFKKTSEFYERRASEVLSIITSVFTSAYVRKWREFFPQKKLQYPSSFHGRVKLCIHTSPSSISSVETKYLHVNNQYDQCFWRLVKREMTEKEAQDFLKKHDKNDVLFDEFNIDCKTMVEDPIKRPRRKIITVHSENIAAGRFWNEQSVLLKELGEFVEEIDNVEHLCNAVSEEFRQDIVFPYGVSDEYSFVLNTSSDIYQRRASKIISAIVSFFTSTCMMRWKDFFPEKELIYPPFDGRAVCCPFRKILRDYLSWRQVDCL